MVGGIPAARRASASAARVGMPHRSCAQPGRDEGGDGPAPTTEFGSTCTPEISDFFCCSMSRPQHREASYSSARQRRRADNTQHRSVQSGCQVPTAALCTVAVQWGGGKMEPICLPAHAAVCSVISTQRVVRLLPAFWPPATCRRPAPSRPPCRASRGAAGSPGTRCSRAAGARCTFCSRPGRGRGR